MFRLLCALMCLIPLHSLFAGVTVSVAVKNYATCVPIVTASGVSGAAEVTLEWAAAESGPYTTLATLAAPAADSCAYTNDWAQIAAKRWYRAKVGDETSDAVAFTRFRRLDRDPNNARSCLSVGVSISYGGYYYFDGNNSTWYDGGSYGNVGLNLGTPYYLSGMRLMPRPTCLERNSYRYWYAARTTEDHSAGTYVKMGYAGQQVANTWMYVASPDTTNTYQYVKFTSDLGNLAEMQMYGWSVDEAASPVGSVSFDIENYSNCCPVITWTYLKDATNVQLQVSRAADHGFTVLAEMTNPLSASAVFTNTSSKVGVKRYYRVVSVVDGEVSASTPIGYTRFRRIDRNPGQENVRFSKYTYSDYRFFDGVLDAAFDGSAAPGIIFNERLYVVGIRTYPRPSWTSRLDGSTFYGYQTSSDVSAGVTKTLKHPVLADEGKWQWSSSNDPETPYYRVTVPCNCNNCEELQVYGWDEADIVAAAESVMPQSFAATSDPDVQGGVILTLSGQQHIAQFQVEYRVEGTSEWTRRAEVLAGDSSTIKFGGLSNGTRYDFRLVGTGDDGWVDYSSTANTLVYKLDPAAGTGIRALLVANATTTPVTDAWTRPTTTTQLYDEIDIETTDPLVEGSSKTWVAFCGGLEVPLDGTYTFKLTANASDGIALYIDDAQVINKLACGGFASGTKTLTAGRHTIRVDWVNVASSRQCRLSWACDGVWEDQLVPQSQLFPADAADLPVLSASGWDMLTATTAGTIPRFDVLANGKIRLRGTATSGGDRYSIPSFTRLVDGDEFACEFTVESVASGKPCLHVASPTTVDNNSLALTPSGWVRMKGSQSKGHAGSGGDLGPTADVFSGAAFGCPYTLCLERKGKVLTFKARSAKATASKAWVTIKTFTSGTSTGGYYNYDPLRVGFSGMEGSYDVTISKLRVIQPGSALRVR